jgi:hypothetical protein
MFCVLVCSRPEPAVVDELQLLGDRKVRVGHEGQGTEGECKPPQQPPSPAPNDVTFIASYCGLVLCAAALAIREGVRGVVESRGHEGVAVLAGGVAVANGQRAYHSAADRASQRSVSLSSLARPVFSCVCLSGQVDNRRGGRRVFFCLALGRFDAVSHTG